MAVYRDLCVSLPAAISHDSFLRSKGEADAVILHAYRDVDIRCRTGPGVCHGQVPERLPAACRCAYNLVHNKNLSRSLYSSAGPLAQLVEQRTLNPLVVGSIPTRPTTTSGYCRNRLIPSHCSRRTWVPAGVHPERSRRAGTTIVGMSREFLARDASFAPASRSSY